MDVKFTKGAALILSLFLSVALWGQRTLTGTVQNEDGQPLIGANISVKGETIGTITDVDGNFEIRAETGDILEVTYVGYISKEVVVEDQSTIAVTLREGEQLEEVVVTAMGISRAEKALGYSAEKLGSDQIMEVDQSNVINALQGQISGATISSKGGGPGQSARIVIRGNSSFLGNNEPLFVIDGIPVDNSTLTVGGGGYRNVSNRIADINPSDIESVSVLKGGAATALYGQRASNGAIVITTKDGKTGETEVNFSTSYGIEEVNKFPETQGVYTQGYAGEYDTNSFWPTWGPTVEEARQIDPDHPADLFNNYKNAYQSGNQYKANLSFNGGNEKATYFTSFGYQNHTGVIPFSDYQNFSVLLKGKLEVTDWLNVGGSVNYMNSGGNRVNYDAFNVRLVYWAPAKDVTDFEQENGSMKGYRNNGTVGNNPIYGAKTNRFEDNVNRYISGVNFELTPLDWMTVRYRLGMDQYTDFRNYTAPAPRGIENEGVFEDNGEGFVGKTQIKNTEITSNLSVEFDRQYDNFDISLTLGQDIFQENYDRTNTLGEELDIYNLYNLGNAKQISTSNYESSYRLMGVYGILSAALKDYLFLDVTARNDWSSTLPVENRSFFYPSAALSYVLSDHLEMPEAISFLKLRASWARIGGDTDPYLINTTYSPVGGVVLENDGTEVNRWVRDDVRGAPNLQPEITTTVDGGFDANFFKNRLGVNFTYYNALSDNQILTVPVSQTTGYSSFLLNAGAIRNSGVEIGLRGTPVSNNDFSWDMIAKFTANNSEIVSIHEGIDQIVIGNFFGYAGSTASMRLIKGQSYGDIYGSSWARYYENPENAPDIILDEGAPYLIGEDGFPEVNDDRLILGNSQPDWIASLTSTWRWKGLSLSVLFDTRQGVQKYNQMDNFHAAFGIAPYTLDRNEFKVFEGFHESGEANTTEVWLGQGESPNGVNYGAGYYRNHYRAVTENFVEDASWIRLRSLNLTYSLPSNWLGGNIRNASISFIGNNLWLSTPYSGFDPEGLGSDNQNATGFAGFNYPNTRSYTFRINLTF